MTEEMMARLQGKRRVFYPRVAAVSRSCGDVDFLLVMGDESEETRELLRHVYCSLLGPIVSL
jgi:hypothetical protein